MEDEPAATRRVAITGASGFLGTALRRALEAEGWTVLPIVRREPRDGEIGWDPMAGRLQAERLEGVDAVVHLAGENLAGLWTPAKKRRIMDSRAVGTRLLAESLARLRNPPGVLVSASGIGYYGDAGDRELTEDSLPGTDFLARVCRAWEEATEPARAAGIRVVRCRTGVVLDPSGGMLAVIAPIFKLGLGGRLGSGQQWLSWISLPDIVAVYRWALEGRLDGPVNACSPHPVRHAEFTRALAVAVHRPAIVPVPAFALRAFTLGMGESMLLASQRGVPAALLAAGFRFERPLLSDVLTPGLD